MKKILALIALLALVTVAADKVRTFRLTVINKSEKPIAIRLFGTEDEDHLYYLNIPEGSRDVPQVSEFDIASDFYNMQLYFIETWDPIYGFSCRQPLPNILVMARNVRIVVLPCNQTPGNPGEPSMRKYLPYPVFGKLHRYWIYRYIY